MSRALKVTALLAGAMLTSSASLAQRDSSVRTDPRWRAYLGCWSTSAAGAPGPDICLLPTADRNTVELVSVLGDSIAPASSLTASGERIARTKDGCTGWDLARWSEDDRRLYMESEYRCGDGAPQRINGMLSHQGDSFSHIEGVMTRGTTGVRVVRFDFTSSLGLPADIVRRLPGDNSSQTWASRVEASAEITTADVLDASNAVGAAVTEAWLAERGQRFSLSARELRILRDAKIPSSVIDMMIAVSNPGVFTVMQGSQPGVLQQPVNQRGLSSAEELALARAGFRGQVNGMPLGYDPIFGLGDPFSAYWGFSQFGRFGRFGQFDQFGQFGGGWFNPYGFNGYQNGGGWFGGGNGPYVIIPGAPTPTTPPGRAVNGLGYTQGGSSDSDRRASPTPSVQSGGGYNSGGFGGGSSSGGGGGGGGGASNGGGGGSSNGGGEQRTAKPRP